MHGAYGVVIDLDTGLEVYSVKEFERGGSLTCQGDGSLLFDGVIRAVTTDCFGRPVKDKDGDHQTYRAKGRFKFIRKNPTLPRVVEGAARCARCPSTLTLQGDDLCPACKAKDRGQRHRMTARRVSDPFDEHPCDVASCRDQYGTRRVAVWMVSDEVIVSPKNARVRLPRLSGLSHWFERGATVAVHHYCQHHYQPPRILDARGEVAEVIEPVGNI